jgi:hypothetical protein
MKKEIALITIILLEAFIIGALAWQIATLKEDVYPPTVKTLTIQDKKELVIDLKGYGTKYIYAFIFGPNGIVEVSKDDYYSYDIGDSYTWRP